MATLTDLYNLVFAVSAIHFFALGVLVGMQR